MGHGPWISFRSEMFVFMKVQSNILKDFNTFFQAVKSILTLHLIHCEIKIKIKIKSAVVLKILSR